MLRMNIYVISLAALIAVTTPALSCTMHAQAPQGGPVQPEPLDASDPRAKRAASVVTLILSGDRAAVIKALEAEGTPGLSTSSQTEATVDAEIARLANKGYRIAEFMTGRGADVIVELDTKGAEPTNIVIRFTPEEPHKIAGFARAMPQG